MSTPHRAMLLAVTIAAGVALPSIHAQDQQRRPDPRVEQIRKLEREIQDLKAQLTRERARVNQQRNQVASSRRLPQEAGAWRWQARPDGPFQGGAAVRGFAANRRFVPPPGPARFQFQKGNARFGPSWRHHHRSRWQHHRFGRMHRPFRSGPAARHRPASFYQFDRFGPEQRGIPARPNRPGPFGPENSR